MPGGLLLYLINLLRECLLNTAIDLLWEFFRLGITAKTGKEVMVIFIPQTGRVKKKNQIVYKKLLQIQKSFSTLHSLSRAAPIPPSSFAKNLKDNIRN